MLETLMLEASKLLTKKEFFSPYRYFTYLFLAITAVWSSIASYYYFSGDLQRSFSAFLTVMICLVISIVIEIFYYFTRKAQANPVIESSPTVTLAPMLIESLPKVWQVTKGLYRYFGGFNWKGKLVVLGSIVMLARIYQALRK